MQLAHQTSLASLLLSTPKAKNRLGSVPGPSGAVQSITPPKLVKADAIYNSPKVYDFVPYRRDPKVWINLFDVGCAKWEGLA
jgi:hypothetical protein